MTTVIEQPPMTGSHPLKAAAETTGQERRAWLRLALLVALLPLAYLPFHFENATAGWVAFVACILGAAALAVPLAKRLFTRFDALFESRTGCNYTTVVNGSPVPRELARKVEDFLTAHGEPTVSRRTLWANVITLTLLGGCSLFFTVLTVMDYRANMSREIVVKLPEGFEHLQPRIAAGPPAQPGPAEKPGETPSPVGGPPTTGGTSPGTTETPIDPDKGADVFTNIATRTMPNVIKTQQSLARAKEAIEAVKRNPAQAQSAVEPVRQAVADLKELSRDENLPPDAREKIATTAEQAEDMLHSLEELAKDPSDKEKKEDFFEKAQTFLEKLVKFLQFLADIYQKLSSIYDQVFGDGAGTSEKTKESAKSGKPSKGGSDAKAGSPKGDAGRSDKLKGSLKRDLSRGSGRVISPPSGTPGGTGGTPPTADPPSVPGSVESKGGPRRTGDIGSAKAKQQLQTKENGAPQFGPSVK
jgi:uncharacterized protein (UPF0147 family)